MCFVSAVDDKRVTWRSITGWEWKSFPVLKMIIIPNLHLLFIFKLLPIPGGPNFSEMSTTHAWFWSWVAALWWIIVCHPPYNNVGKKIAQATITFISTPHAKGLGGTWHWNYNIIIIMKHTKRTLPLPSRTFTVCIAILNPFFKNSMCIGRFVSLFRTSRTDVCQQRITLQTTFPFSIDRLVFIF